MILAEIEREIRPLGRPEKVRLMHFLIDEIARDETDPVPSCVTDIGSDVNVGGAARNHPDPARYFRPGDRHIIQSPYDEHRAAYQLQQLLEEQQR